MPEPLTKEEQKQLFKEALVEFLKNEREQIQKNIGAFVIRWVAIGVALALFHLTFHGKYQEISDYLVDLTK